MENNQENVVLNGEPVENTQTQPPVAPQQEQPQVYPCPVCGTPYIHTCPQCGFSPYNPVKKPRKSIFKRWWFWLIAVVLTFSLMIGSASCMFSFMTADSESDSEYETSHLCNVGDVEVNLIAEKSWREDYKIILELEVQNNGDENVSFYPTRVFFDGTKGEARCDFSDDDLDINLSFNWDSYYAEDESIILKPGKTHLVTLSFESKYDDTEELLIEDLREVLFLDFNFNVADPDTLTVKDTTQVTVALNDIKANQKYYEYE